MNMAAARANIEFVSCCKTSGALDVICRKFRRCSTCRRRYVERGLRRCVSKGRLSPAVPMPVRRDPNTPEYNRPTEALSIEGPRLHEPLHLGRPTQALSRSVQPRPHTPQHRALELTLAPADMARRQWGAEARLWPKPAPAHMLRWRDTPYEETPQTKVTPTLKGLRTALVARSELIRPVVAICRNNCIARYNIARSIQRDPAGELPSLKVTIDLDMDNQIQRPLSWWSYMVRSVSLGERFTPVGTCCS
jgi:hypothetical protein